MLRHSDSVFFCRCPVFSHLLVPRCDLDVGLVRAGINGKSCVGAAGWNWSWEWGSILDNQHPRGQSGQAQLKSPGGQSC